MLQILLPMAALIIAGALWRPLRPLELDADGVRKSLTGLVYVLLLPALVLEVLWKAPIGIDSLRIILMASTAVVGSAVVASLIYRPKALPQQARGALLIAAAWPNATYLGLPVLEQTFGTEFRSVALQYDLLAATPLLLTIGILIAQQHGEGEKRHPLAELVRVPAFWAATAAITLNINQIPMPNGVGKTLELLGNSVPPLMLLALGMGLRWDLLHWRILPRLIPALLIQLMLMPLILYWASFGVGLEGDLRAAVVLEAAMPTMVLGMVICDRYHLDTALFAAATTLSTALSLITLPLWYGWLS
ncbi:MAG: AEC family transporter [Gammaproteobacteria bacterium]|jgi:hypothetical protein|nr:AEC family transporter [Gammaproteobacteria bacterium]MBT4606571.1 AEC family transporter [Thiotrichales bacterium]MBT3472044.1 AEC family transporter [Gammaproteobacteria bacterium]MBT3966900.1 AEC family transporter [Gammaproteobacteria bacterium]MBT4081221.1 AEC family transporter [Gammaproteobacteria bacterium]